MYRHYDGGRTLFSSMARQFIKEDEKEMNDRMFTKSLIKSKILLLEAVLKGGKASNSGSVQGNGRKGVGV